MRTFVLAVLAIGVLGVVGRAWADEEKLPLDKMPKAVMDTVKKRFPKAEAVEGSKETIDGKVEYEVEIKDGGKKIDVTTSPEGVLLCIEREIDAKTLPKAVTAAIDAKYPKATIKFAEDVTKVKDGKEKLEYYETLLTTADNKSVELEITPDGKIQKTEDKTGKKD